MEPFKNLIGPATVANAGHHLRRAWPTFDRKRFEAQAATGLEQLEFKARAMQLADALEATLPDDFNAACELLEASLAPPLAMDAQGEPLKLGEARDAVRPELDRQAVGGEQRAVLHDHRQNGSCPDTSC